MAGKTMAELFPAMQVSTPKRFNTELLTEYTERFMEGAVVAYSDNSDETGAPFYAGGQALADLFGEFDGGQRLYHLPRYTVGNNAINHWKRTGETGELEKEIIGVPVFPATQYQAYAPESNADGNPITQCASWDGQNGFGNPGGKCALCPFQRNNAYKRKDAQEQGNRDFFIGKPEIWQQKVQVNERGNPIHCQSRARVILATTQDELPVVLDITGASSTGLKDWRNIPGNQRMRGVFGFSLVTHPKYNSGNYKTSEVVWRQVGMADDNSPEYQQAMAWYETVLADILQDWVESVATAGQGDYYDPSKALGAVQAPTYAALPERHPDQADVDELPF